MTLEIQFSSPFHSLSLKNTDWILYFPEHQPTPPPTVLAFFETLLPEPTLQHLIPTHHDPFEILQGEPFAYILCHRSAPYCFLVRDHLGMQPLYYTQNQHLITIGVRIPDLLQSLNPRPPFSSQAIRDLFSESPRYSTQTLYQGIFRVEPGHILQMSTAGCPTSAAYWTLHMDSPLLENLSFDEVQAEFQRRLDQAIQQACQSVPPEEIGAEFSAGLDSSAVIAGAHTQGIHPTLFMHMPKPHTQADFVYNRHHEHRFLERLNIPETQVHRIEADEHFDPIQRCRHIAEALQEPIPHLFYTFATPIHEAIQRSGKKIILSGFGGDQGVSGHAPLRFYPQNRLKKWIHTLKQKLKYLAEPNPLQALDLRSLRHLEHDLLVGRNSHEIRIRIEYCSLLSQAYGFEYRYPLLHPKLLEFYFALPDRFKRQGTKNRLQLRQYIAHHLQDPLFDHQKKSEGLYIMSSGWDSFVGQYYGKAYGTLFDNLPEPYLSYINHADSPHQRLINTLKAWMCTLLPAEKST